MDKNMRKHLLLVALVLVAALAAVGCGGGSESASTTPASTPAATSTAAPAATVTAADLAMTYLREVPSNKNIAQVDDVVTRLLAGEDLFIVDIRQPDVYGQGHLKGAINVPWGTAASYEIIKNLPTDQPVYTYCYTGQTAGQWMALMQVAGIDVRSINLGWVRGLSKHERIADVTETTANAVDTTINNTVNQVAYDAIAAYFTDTATRAGGQFANNIIQPAAAKAILDAQDQSVVFVSLRRAADYAAGHIPTAINMPYDETLPGNIANLSADKTLIAYCYSGQTSGQVVAMWRLMGLDAYSLNSGFGTPATVPGGWSNQEGYPIATN